MLTGENSILNQAGRAREKTKISGIKEQIQVSIMGALSEENGKLKDSKFREEIMKNISEINDNDITGNEKKGWQVKVNDKAYAISKTGEINEVFWMYDEDGSIENVDGTITGIHIGDTINYVATEDVKENERTIVSTADVNGFGNQTINLNDYTGTWRVLGVENGKLNIVASKNAGIIASNNETWLTGVFASSYLKLKGKVGYQNAEKELNRVCSLYGKGKYAQSARSINVDDINKITGYDPNHIGVNINTATTEQIAAGTKYNQGSLGEYGSTVSFFWDGTSFPKYTSNTINGNLKEEHNKRIYMV